jgi:hypothetical protein
MSTSDSSCAIVLGLPDEFLERYRDGERLCLKEYTARPSAAPMCGVMSIRSVYPFTGC